MKSYSNRWVLVLTAVASSWLAPALLTAQNAQPTASNPAAKTPPPAKVTPLNKVASKVTAADQSAVSGNAAAPEKSTTENSTAENKTAEKSPPDTGTSEKPAAPEQPATPRPLPRETPKKITVQELSAWIDSRFEAEYNKAGTPPAELVDDAAFLRRASLDLQGRIPTVAQFRDFLTDESPYKRQVFVDRLLVNDQAPERYARRTSEHLARVWRRMMIPASSPNPAVGMQLEPWLALKFAENEPYDLIARKLLQPAADGMQARPLGIGQAANVPVTDAAATSAFQVAVGNSPENLTGAYVRVFLGIRLHCAQCHDHPMADWKRDDFWGVAALLSGNRAPSILSVFSNVPTIKPTADDKVFTAKLLGEKDPIKLIPSGKSPRDVFADWMVSPQNPYFAATTVNRVWQYLCGRGLAGSVDNLDLVSPPERKILDELAVLFVDSGYDVRWLVAGICKSKVYQQAVRAESEASDGDQHFVHRPLKTLLPEQVFDSLEQALGLPVARADNGPRFNGDRDRFVARMNESAPEVPSDFKGGVPQALMLMNGKLTADATSLETSRTLRAVVEAPFLRNEEKIETLYLAALTRPPRQEEMAFLVKHVDSKGSEEDRKQAYAEILWGILNSPEFLLNP